MLVKMPDGNWLNPQHVAGVELEKMRTDIKTWVHFAKASSFRVQALSFPGDRRDEIAMLINRGEVMVNMKAGMEVAKATAYAQEEADPKGNEGLAKLVDKMTDDVQERLSGEKSEPPKPE